MWRQLDPLAGQLPPRSVRRLRLAVVATVVALLVGGIGWRSGVVVPLLAAAGSPFHSMDWQTRHVEYAAVLRNDGWGPVEVLGAGRDGPGLDLVEVRGAFPTVLGPDDQLEVVVAYRVTDCAAVTADPWPLTVRVGRFWGEYTVQVELPYLTVGAPSGLRYYEGRDPYAVEWQRALADGACGHGF